jgi:hypothetical protein
MRDTPPPDRADPRDAPPALILRALPRDEERRVGGHKARCRGAGAEPSENELARMVAEFHARGGRVTVCPDAHALPVRNGAGRDAERWVA